LSYYETFIVTWFDSTVIAAEVCDNAQTIDVFCVFLLEDFSDNDGRH